TVDGPSGPDEPHHGRALRPRGPGHPRHRDHGVPAVTVPDRSAAAIFRPVRGRVVPIVIGVAILVGAVALAVVLPEQYRIMDRLTCAGIGVGVAAFMYRYATIHARPSEEGLHVRNLGPGEVVPWEE